MFLAALGSPDIPCATNACGILCTLTLASQQARSAVASAKHIIANIEQALASGSNQLPHNAALLISMLSSVASFRRNFVKSLGLKHLVNLLNQSEDSGEQCNVLFALVALAEAGRDCHSELYDSLVASEVTWKARQLMGSAEPTVQANARTLAQKLRNMPQALSLGRTGSSDAVHALALLSCDTKALAPTSPDQVKTPSPRRGSTKSMSGFSPNRPSKRRLETLDTLAQASRKVSRIGDHVEQANGFLALDSLASLTVQAAV